MMPMNHVMSIINAGRCQVERIIEESHTVRSNYFGYICVSQKCVLPDVFEQLAG